MANETINLLSISTRGETPTSTGGIKQLSEELSEDNSLENDLQRSKRQSAADYLQNCCPQLAALFRLYAEDGQRPLY